MFPVSDGSTPPPFPPPRFTRVPCPPGNLSRILYHFFKLPPLRPCLCSRPSPSSSIWSPVVRLSEVFSPLADGRPISSPRVLSSAPLCTFAPPPRPVRLVVLGLGVGGGSKEMAPPAVVWSPLTRQQASPGLAYQCGACSILIKFDTGVYICSCSVISE